MKKKRDRKACTIHVRVPCWLKKTLKQEAKHFKISLSQAVVNICSNTFLEEVMISDESLK